MGQLLGGSVSLSAYLIQDPLVGTGPIELSPGVQQGFEQDQKERAPGHFAVSTDGSYASYNYCPDGRYFRGLKPDAIHYCEKGSSSVPCKIYGAHGEAVWNTEAETGN